MRNAGTARSICPSRALSGLFVTGTGTDVGKTVAAAALLRALRGLGLAAQAVKPVQTGVAPSEALSSPLADAPVYAAAVADLACMSQLSPAVALHCFPLPASPHLAAARVGERLDVAELCHSIRAHWARQSTADFLLVEGAGGLRVPLNEREDMLDLMAALDLPVLLVGGNSLGALNHALLSLEALQNRGLHVAALVLITALPEEHGRANAEQELILRDNAALLRARLQAAGSDAPVLELPRLARLDAAGWQLLSRRMLPLAQALQKRSGERGRPELSADLLPRDHRCVWHPYASAVQLPPLHVARRSHHNRIVLADGRELIDGMSSWWAAAHGYNHPRLLHALRAQAERMPHVMFGGLTHAPAVTLAERLLALMPPGLSRVFFADSGSVAVEVALKMAIQCQKGRGEARRTRFLTPRGGYHGDTLGAMSVCDPVTGMHSLFSVLLPRQIFMERPACRFDAPFDETCLDDARRLLKAHRDEIAAVILEPVVQGAGGMWFYHPAYLRGLAGLCREAGALLIFDEIATGFGRTGKMFAAEWAGVTPDILCCGKALTGGVLTLAATACTARVARDICRDNMVFMHGPTFMANALACAVANAALDLLEQGAWPQQVAGLENSLRAGLAPCATLPGVADVRVLGGIGVVETRQPVNTAALQAYFVEQGVWIRPFNRLIYLMPPFISPAEDVARLCEAVQGALRAEAHLP